jgi:hypothetical protein
MDKEQAEDSFQARAEANNWLEREGFSKQGFYCNGKADWFKVGGRWSGVLSGITEERDRYAELGYEDDAQLFTKEIAQRLLTLTDIKECEYVDIELMSQSEGNMYVLCQQVLESEKEPEFWIVVIDYHC